MDERVKFVARLLDGEPMSGLCEEFSTSRKTGYKILKRYRDCGVEGLTDRSRRPHRHANQLPLQIETLIVRLKREDQSRRPGNIMHLAGRAIEQAGEPGIEAGLEGDRAGMRAAVSPAWRFKCEHQVVGLDEYIMLSESTSVSDIDSQKPGIEARMKHLIMKHQNLLKGLIRLHILHHASEEEFFGQWMIYELARHGYRLSPGTLYPMLHALERQGYLKSRKERSGRTFRRLYRATPLGRKANKIAKIQVRELTTERPDGSRHHAEED